MAKNKKLTKKDIKKLEHILGHEPTKEEKEFYENVYKHGLEVLEFLNINWFVYGKLTNTAMTKRISLDEIDSALFAMSRKEIDAYLARYRTIVCGTDEEAEKAIGEMAKGLFPGQSNTEE